MKYFQIIVLFFSFHFHSLSLRNLKENYVFTLHQRKTKSTKDDDHMLCSKFKFLCKSKQGNVIVWVDDLDHAKGSFVFSQTGFPNRLSIPYKPLDQLSDEIKKESPNIEKEQIFNKINKLLAKAKKSSFASLETSLEQIISQINESNEKAVNLQSKIQAAIKPKVNTIDFASEVQKKKATRIWSYSNLD